MADKKETNVKRYNLVLPQSLYDELSREAKRHGMTFVQLVRKFFRFGLIALKAQEDPESAIIIRDRDGEREVIFL